MESVADFKKGMRVVYVPSHVRGNLPRMLTFPDLVKKKDLEHGVVKSTNDRWVFVLYDNLEMKMTTGDEPYTAKATDPNDLILEDTV